MLSRQASVQIENLQEQLQAIAAQRDRAVMDLASIQEQAHQYQTSLSNLQLVLEQFQRGMVCPLQQCILKHCHSCQFIIVIVSLRTRISAQSYSRTGTERDREGLGAC